MELPAETGLAPDRYAFGLTEPAVRQLQDIIRREFGVDLTLADTWSRAVEILSLAQMLLEALPEKPLKAG